MGVRKGRSGEAGVVYLDTHSAIWLARGSTDWLSKQAQKVLAFGELRLSPMVVLELQILHEKRRIAVPVGTMLNQLLVMAGVTVCPLPWTSVVEAAVELNWTRDPYDRLIVAHAAVQQAPLITSGALILQNYERALC